jgi:AcrR family transcriptional regulator
MEKSNNWNETRTNMRQERKLQVLRVAITLFKEQGIEPCTLADIADRAGVGIASLYRYFKTRQDLVIAAAGMYWQEEFEDLYKKHQDEANRLPTGRERSLRILETFLEIYDNHPEFLRFLEQFDQYVVREKVAEADLGDYDRIIGSFRNILEQAVVEGIADGSVRSEVPVALFCSATLKGLISLAQKMVSRAVIIPSDRALDGRAELHVLIDMARSYLTSGRSSPGSR